MFHVNLFADAEARKHLVEDILRGDEADQPIKAAQRQAQILGDELDRTALVVGSLSSPEMLGRLLKSEPMSLSGENATAIECLSEMPDDFRMKLVEAGSSQHRNREFAVFARPFRN